MGIQGVSDSFHDVSDWVLRVVPPPKRAVAVVNAQPLIAQPLIDLLSGEESERVHLALHKLHKSSHFLASTHSEIHNIISVSLPCTLMPSYDRLILGGLDSALLKVCEVMKEYRVLRVEEHVNDWVRMKGSDTSSDMIFSSAQFDKLSAELASMLPPLIAKIEQLTATLPLAIGYWLTRYIDFQMEFFARMGQEVLGLEKGSVALREGLSDYIKSDYIKSDYIKPQPSDPNLSVEEDDPITMLLGGDVPVDVIVSPPGWSDRTAGKKNKTPNKTPKKNAKDRIKSNFGISDSAASASSQDVDEDDNSWRVGMLRRRNVSFFKSNSKGGETYLGSGGGWDDDEEEEDGGPGDDDDYLASEQNADDDDRPSRNVSRKNSATYSSSNSRRNSSNNNNTAKDNLDNTVKDLTRKLSDLKSSPQVATAVTNVGGFMTKLGGAFSKNKGFSGGVESSDNSRRKSGLGKAKVDTEENEARRRHSSGASDRDSPGLIEVNFNFCGESTPPRGGTRGGGGEGSVNETVEFDAGGDSD